MKENELSQIMIGAAIEMHKVLGGPGLLENVYEEALAWEIQQRVLELSGRKLSQLCIKRFN
jgi:GxxExxY protein